MFSSFRARIFWIVVALGGSLYYLWSTYDSCVESRRASGGEVEACTPVRLGLDLQGGMHLALEVDDPEGGMSPEALSDAIDRAERIVRTRIDEFGVEEPLIQKVGNDRLIVELPGIRDEERAKDVIRRSAFLEFKLVLPVSEVESGLARVDRAVVQALGEEGLAELGAPVEEDETDRRDAGEPTLEDLLFRDDTTPAEAPDAQPDTGEDAPEDGPRDPAADAPDTADAADVADTAGGGDGAEASPGDRRRPFTRLLLEGDREGTFLVASEDVPALERMLALPEVQRALPRNVDLALGSEPVGMGGRTFRYVYVLEDTPFMTGDRLVNATAGRDPQFNQPQVEFELSRAGGRQFERFTAQHVGDHLSILLDGQVVSAPVIRDRIGARGVIEMGQAPMEEARDLALVLRAGALPVPLRVMEERTVGPSLGQESVDQGRMAGLLGLLLVVIVMIAYYRMAGVLAVGALTIYVVLVMGGLAAIGAALTLPGIAGLILSVGMAVDANVLIFERIREELDAGRATRTAVDEGFGHALSAIVDANITTLITALILFQFGTGPVRGFAITLSIGIVASFFSALYVTRTFFLLYLRNKRASDPISI